PPILGYAFENIDAKLEGLQQRGFRNPTKMVESSPTILGYAFENIDQKLEGLQERGFSNPRKMIESSPTILGLAFENIDQKLEGLQQRGFRNPTKMVESLPAILGLAFENIDQKLEWLQQRGFRNPTKMVESLPTILGYAFENIDRRLRFLEKVIHLYGLPFAPVELMEEVFPLSFSTKLDKIFVLARIMREYQVVPTELDTKTIRALIGSNLEDVLVALGRSSPSSETIEDFIKRVRSIKKQNIPKETKRQIVEDDLNEFQKTKRRYLRGYP
ncbi:hypothetical protein HYT33_00875, partial [Candidatus Roizmanbacteria bacterium]|nr:hypothetical protein [Candidatus Roizmanbacteria bacterium]